eukprot:gene17705-biopygen2349
MARACPAAYHKPPFPPSQTLWIKLWMSQDSRWQARLPRAHRIIEPHLAHACGGSGRGANERQAEADPRREARIFAPGCTPGNPEIPTPPRAPPPPVAGGGGRTPFLIDGGARDEVGGHAIAAGGVPRQHPSFVNKLGPSQASSVDSCTVEGGQVHPCSE